MCSRIWWVLADEHCYGRDFGHAVRVGGLVLLRQAHEGGALRRGA
ncbi:hypothetical protein ABZ345_28440 [Lentzea sp. NPDC005914]